MKPGHKFTRTVRMLTAEIRLALTGCWMTQRELAGWLNENQRTINSRIQLMWALGELKKRNQGYGTTEYSLK